MPVRAASCPGVLRMKSSRLPIDELVLIEPKRFGDDRGFFSEIFRAEWFRREVADVDLVQENHSLSRVKGTIRGLHFQAPNFVQGKLVRAARGAILDVAVDIRHGSPTFGRHVAVELSAENGHQLWVPAGFAHGFCTLESDTEVVYKVSDYYSAADDRGVAFDDPQIGIAWPCDLSAAVLSQKDRQQPKLAELPVYFPFGA
jgi:dTDP-4-dehydrorhamnose 3,5-epimerase